MNRATKPTSHRAFGLTLALALLIGLGVAVQAQARRMGGSEAQGASVPAAYEPRSPHDASALRSGPHQVEPGESLVLQVEIGAVEDLAAFEAMLIFDPALLRPGGYWLERTLPVGSQQLPPARPSPGRYAIGSFTPLNRTGTGPGILARVVFEAIASGTAEVSLDPSASGAFDRFGGSLAAPLKLTWQRGPTVYLPRVANGAE